jgi:hypothetical protein
MEDPEQLLAHPENWRRHPGVQRDAMRDSLSQVGWVQNVIANTTTGHLIDGHLRVEEALSRGEQVPVLYVTLTEDEERLVLATLDPLGALASVDAEALGTLRAELGTDSTALQQMLDDILGAHSAVPTPGDLFSGFRDGLDKAYGGATFLVTFEFPASAREGVGTAITEKGKAYWVEQFIMLMTADAVD